MAIIYGNSKRLVKAACWFARYLHIADSDFELNIVRRKLDGDIRALCSFDFDYKYAEIEINSRLKLKHEDTFETLAHEMVHIKQYVLEELNDENEVYIWKGEPYIYDGSDEAYWNSPWEVEAYGRQKGLNFLRMKDNYAKSIN